LPENALYIDAGYAGDEARMQGIVREIKEDRKGRVKRFRREQCLDHGVKIIANQGPARGGVIKLIEGVLPSILKQRVKSWQNECLATGKALYVALRFPQEGTPIIVLIVCGSYEIAARTCRAITARTTRRTMV
jgi:hypothetical protein